MGTRGDFILHFSAPPPSLSLYIYANKIKLSKPHTTEWPLENKIVNSLGLLTDFLLR